MQITTIGIDIAKNVFHVVCCNAKNKIVRKKAVKRRELLHYVTNLPKSIVAMEACSTSNYWGREIASLGHKVKLLPAQHVKAFLTGNKNDYNDAYAIVVASQQAHIKAVPIKTIEEQDNQLIHKVRELAIGQRTALSNQIRGLLLEYGVSIKQGIKNLRKDVVDLLDETSSLSSTFRQVLAQLYSQLVHLDKTIKQYDEHIKKQVASNDACQRLQTIPGVGPIVASGYYNEVGNGRHYKRGRDVSASLGLVPRQHSTGGKDILLGISKRGNRYLRYLLVQGAKAVVSRAKNKTDKLSQWINRIVATRGHNKACVAYANKMARIAWAITVSGESYQAL
ncbi:IS110 family transposase [Litorilituus sediminis]|uniref:IS110 family transposase n=1 Tax=Litorilituus sediminis TaxID=718192 RepID=A0A4P6P1J2_9GAMM|nr:IS110 family transposase [Litorilituus sediminis]QBG35166.1 IS110 family transposase [Litorilituus sediminis]QBG36465.1 IS110 family transposase [Litorilituus sediminis]